MSVKVAKVTSATATPRELRSGAINHEGSKSTKDARRRLRRVFQQQNRRTASCSSLCVFVFFVPSWSMPFQQQAPERRDGEPHRLVESVRRDRLRCDAALIADVAAAVGRRVAVQQLGVEAGAGDADPI